jgi:hypothetical protein
VPQERRTVKEEARQPAWKEDDPEEASNPSQRRDQAALTEEPDRHVPQRSWSMENQQPEAAQGNAASQ